MQPGHYRHRITIESASESRTTLGGQSLTWSTFASRWARIIPSGGREYMVAAQAGTRLEAVFECSGYAAVTTGMRVVFDSRYFSIVGVRGLDGKSPSKAAWIQIECVEGPHKASA